MNLFSLFRRIAVCSATIAPAMFLGAAITAAAAEPVALALETAGEISPPLEAYSEIEAGRSFDLGAGGRVVFLHYPTCQNVTVEGGKLNLSVENFRVNKGKIVDISKAECPQRIQLASNAGIAGVVLRGAADEKLKVSQRPRFLVLGALPGQFKQMAILQGGKSLLLMPLDGKPLIWPESENSLPPANDYTVELTGADAKVRQFSLQVTNQKSQTMPAIIQIEQ